MASIPKISVVVATFNRRDTIAVTLRCLERQTLRPEDFEVIVVDDGSGDGTDDMVHSLSTSLNCPISYLKHPNAGPGFTQNRGILAAKAPVVCLIADDIHLAPGALEAHLSAHAMHPEPGAAVLGKVVQDEEMMKTVFLKSWDPFRFGELDDFSELPYYFFWACNISCKREFLLKNGLFKEARGVGGAASHEDVELGCRLHRKGMRLFYSRDALGYHHHVETLDGAARRAYERGLNWNGFWEGAEAPEVAVHYHIVNMQTLRHHIRAYMRPARLLRGARNPLTLLLRYSLRAALFNTLSVRLFWLPLMRLAERNSRVAPLMRASFYRHVMAHYFYKGIAQGRARPGTP